MSNLPAPLNRQPLLRHRAADIFVDRVVPTLSVVGAALMALGGFTFTDEARQLLSTFFWTPEVWKWVGIIGMVFGIVLLFPAKIAAYWNSKRITDLEKERDEALARLADTETDVENWAHQITNLVRGILYDVAVDLDFGRGERHLERLTIYAHENGPGGGHFVPFGRISFNTDYDRISRQVYPDSQGVIAEAWRHGEDWVPELPEFEEDSEAYFAACETLNLPRETVQAMRMKSRFVYGKRISDDTGRNPLAVVVVESRTPNRYEKERLRHIFGIHEKMLSQLVQRIRPILPATASGKGY